ncbi:hypothetical protein MMC11_004240 [Xylographa trunciseda]|nr:hypothetical protein [Xylographa trunciseda]
MTYYIQILTACQPYGKPSMATATITNSATAEASGTTTFVDANTTTLAVPSPPSTALAKPSNVAHPPPALDDPPSTPFPFLLLPGELRNAIYALVLTPSAPSGSSCNRRLHHHPNQHLTPSVLRVCRLLHSESAPYLYAHCFRAHSSLLTSFPHFADPARPLTSRFYISLIRKWRISVRLDTDPNWSRRQVTDAFSGVEELRVDVWEASFGTAGVRVLEGFWGVRGVGRARVDGCVERGMGRWLERLMESDLGVEVEDWDGGDEDGKDGRESKVGFSEGH